MCAYPNARVERIGSVATAGSAVSLDFDRVETHDLVKLFGPTPALAGVSLRFDAGTITVVEGPNGSGKTTLLAILALLTRPTQGQLRFGAHEPRRRPALRGQIGFLGHAAMVYPDLSGEENLALCAALYGVAWGGAELARTRERFGLGPWLARPTRTYSRGQLQRVALARALMHAPRLLLLDEPSTGLDEASADRLVRAVKDERARGAIVVAVTHDTAFAEALADRRVRLDAGRVAGAAS